MSLALALAIVYFLLVIFPAVIWQTWESLKLPAWDFSALLDDKS